MLMLRSDPEVVIPAAHVEDRAVALRDGVRVGIRPMHADDAEALVRFHRRLSLETVRSRFFSVHPELSPREVERFTHVDHDAREAIVALVNGELIAVARYERLPATDAAEVAFVVADAWQGRGLGSALFQVLADRARSAGIRRFTAETLVGNRRMLAVFGLAGLPMRFRATQGTIEVAIDLGPATE